MKNKNKISMLAAIGITLSVVTIAVRVDVASATGSYGSAHSHDWSSEHGHHDWSRHKWFEGEGNHYHAGDLYDEDSSCSCQTNDTDQSTNTSQDETTDESMPNADDADEIDSEDTGVDSHEESCHDSDSTDETDSDSDSEVSDEEPADESPESPPSDQPEDPVTPPADDGNVNGDLDTPLSDDNEQPPAQPTNPTNHTNPANQAIELSVDTKVKVNDGTFIDAETDGDAAVGQVGGSATWQITVMPVQVDPADARTIKVEWVAPDNVEVIGSTADNGTYDGSVWTIPVTKLPAVLTVSTTIAKPGLGASNAIISKISCEEIIANGNGFCDFNDGVANNNANPAGVIASAATVPNENTGAGTQSGSAGTGTLGASTGNQGSEGAENSGVLGANTTRGGQGGEGVVHAKETDANGVLGVATALPEVANQGAVLAASTGALASTGVSAYVMVLIGAVMFSTPVVLVAVTTKKH